MNRFKKVLLGIRITKNSLFMLFENLFKGLKTKGIDRKWAHRE